MQFPWIVILRPLCWSKDLPECVERICRVMAFWPTNSRVLVKELHWLQSHPKYRGRSFAQEGRRMTVHYRIRLLSTFTSPDHPITRFLTRFSSVSHPATSNPQ